MAQADLEVYDENGFATLTAATLFGRVLGSGATGTQDGSAYFPGLTTGGAEAWYMTSIVAEANIRCLPRFTLANDTLSWAFTDIYVGNGNAPRVATSFIVGTD